jgi:hypothetical protein
MGLFPPDAGLRIAMVAGEASGDMLGARLIDAIRARRPDARFVGIGGPKMQAAGLESLFPQETLAVRGYVEVLRNLRAILAIRRELKAKLLAERPDVFIGVDAPDFNLAVEHSLKAAGIRTIHYVSLAYFNSSSTKMLFSLFEILNNAVLSGNVVVLNWFYDEDDDTILEFGEEIADDFAANLLIDR